jgi:hypothetical protein
MAADTQCEHKGEAARFDVVQLDYFYRQLKRSAAKRRQYMAEERRRGLGSREMQRKAAKKALLAIMESVGVTDGKDRALAIYSLRSGLSVARLRVYLEELIDAGLVEVEDNEVKIPGEATVRKEAGGT